MIRCPRVFSPAWFSLLAICVSTSSAQHNAISPAIAAPISIYSEDSVSGAPLSETRALHEVEQLARLKTEGVHFDYDLISVPAFGIDSPMLRPEGWPDGTRTWIEKCQSIGVRPGLQIDGNSLTPPELAAALQTWYDRGVRLFDFKALNPAPAKSTQSDDADRSAAALRDALRTFRERNRDAVLLVPSGETGAAHSPANADFASHVDAAGIGGFTILSTDPARLVANPEANVWRSIDIQRDAAVRRFEQAGIPLAQIESPGFTASRAADLSLHAWKSEFLLSMARGGWVNAMHGDLSLIEESDARWMARAQKVFLGLQEQGHVHSFGGAAGSSDPYGFVGADTRGAIYVVVNPSGKVTTMDLPQSETGESAWGAGRVQFRDNGYIPHLKVNSLTLGPGQMAMVGYGAYSAPAYNLGIEQDVVIPQSVEELDADFHSSSPGALEASLNPPIEGVLRVIVRPRKSDGISTNGRAAGRTVTLDATQSGRPIPIRLDAGNSGAGDPSWVVGEIDVNDLTPGVPLLLKAQSSGPHPPELEGSAYAVVD